MGVDFVENLREKLEQQASALEELVERLERDRENANLGSMQTLMHVTAIEQYEAIANQLLAIVRDDKAALAALSHAAALRKRVAVTN